MRRERILEYLRAALIALRREGLESPVIVGPNEIADAADAPTLLQIYTREHDRRRETERCVVERLSGAIVVNARLGEGAKRLDAVAEMIADFFADGRPGARGFANVESDGRRTLVYVVGVRRGGAEVVDGRYKTTVHIDFDIILED